MLAYPVNNMRWSWGGKCLIIVSLQSTNLFRASQTPTYFISGLTYVLVHGEKFGCWKKDKNLNNILFSLDVYHSNENLNGYLHRR